MCKDPNLQHPTQGRQKRPVGQVQVGDTTYLAEIQGKALLLMVYDALLNKQASKHPQDRTSMAA